MNNNKICRDKRKMFIVDRYGNLSGVAVALHGHIYIPNYVKRLQRYAFCGQQLESVDIPDCVLQIDKYVFSNCTNLKKVSLPNALEVIEDYLFYYSALSSIIIPNSVLEIGEGSFAWCKCLTSLILPDNVWKISKNAFSHCLSLSSITLSRNIKIIEPYAFCECEQLTNIELPGGLSEINEGAFCKCQSLKSITIPKLVKNIGANAFMDCKSLETITVDKNNQYFISIDGCLYSRKNQTLLFVPPSKNMECFTIPKWVTSIAENAFRGNKNLKSIEIPETISSIGNSAFANCEALISLVVHAEIQNVGNHVFVNCRNLHSVVLPNAELQHLLKQTGAFIGCDSLPITLREKTETNTSNDRAELSPIPPQIKTEISETAFNGHVEFLTGDKEQPVDVPPSSYDVAGFTTVMKNYEYSFDFSSGINSERHDLRTPLEIDRAKNMNIRCLVAVRYAIDHGHVDISLKDKLFEVFSGDYSSGCPIKIIFTAGFDRLGNPKMKGGINTFIILLNYIILDPKHFGKGLFMSKKQLDELFPAILQYFADIDTSILADNSRKCVKSRAYIEIKKQLERLESEYAPLKSTV